jgi:hypothetical protein
MGHVVYPKSFLGTTARAEGDRAVTSTSDSTEYGGSAETR